MTCTKSASVWLSAYFRAKAVVGKARVKPFTRRPPAPREEEVQEPAGGPQTPEEAPEEAPVWTRILSGFLPGSKGAPKGAPKGALKDTTVSRRKSEADVRDRERDKEVEKAPEAFRRKSAAALGPSVTEPKAQRRPPRKEAFAAPGGPRETRKPSRTEEKSPSYMLAEREASASLESIGEKRERPSLVRTRSSELFLPKPLPPPHSHSDEEPPRYHETPEILGGPRSRSIESSEPSEGPLSDKESTEYNRPRRPTWGEGGGGPSGGPSLGDPSEQLLGRIQRMGSRTIPSPQVGSPAASSRPGASGAAPSGGPSLPSRQASMAFLGSVNGGSERNTQERKGLSSYIGERRAPHRPSQQKSFSRNPSVISLGGERTLQSPRMPPGAPRGPGGTPKPRHSTRRSGSTAELELGGDSHEGDYRRPPRSDSGRVPVATLDLSRVRGPH